MSEDPAYFSVKTPYGDDKLKLLAIQGEERLSGLFHFTLEMIAEDRSLDFSTIVGQGVTVTFDMGDGKKRYLHGLVSRFMEAGSSATSATYFAELQPKLAQLTMSSDCKIFQNQTAVAIVTSVFDDLGLTDYEDRTQGTYTEREYCVQYNETAFAFISRLLEDEGVFYFFEHSDGKHNLVLADDVSAFKDCEGGDKVSFGHSEEWLQQNVVTECRLEQSVIPGAVDLDDFDFETPSTDLAVATDSTVATDGSKRRLFSYPGGFATTSDGESRAKLRIEGHEWPQKLLRGTSLCPAFVAGGKTTLEKHFREDLNATWVIERVSHAANARQYQNSFVAFPSETPYRPQMATPRPVIPGTQTAIVVGKSGEEIWTDKYGRVKVQFHWDRVGKSDEASSCWIRVAHGWAGKTWGQIFLPRIGQEVVVSFVNGDPDKPLITGGVYNAEQTVPYALPDNQTQSTVKSNSSKGGGGSNELRFEDKKDSEEIYLHAQKDHNLVIENDRTKQVKNDETNTITQNRKTTIEEGNDTLTIEKGDRTFDVQTGKETYDVKGTRTLTITGKESHANKDDFEQTVDKNYTLTVSGDLTIDVTGKITFKSGGTMSIESGGNMTVKSGGSLAVSASTTVEQKAGTSLTNKAGTDLTNQAGTSLTNKAGTTMENNAGISLTNKASASQTVDGGGMLECKGGLVKIN